MVANPFHKNWLSKACPAPSVCLQRVLTKEDVDARMVRALADLPSDLGMEAVEKFATSNLESVRSKTGFMVRMEYLSRNL